jgi:cell volume regulation protein A
MAAGLAASLLARRLRVPGLVLFLGIGMLVGSEGLGWVAFDDYGLARTTGVIALSLILFEGGLNTGFKEIGPVLSPALSLAVLGTLLTALATGLAAAALFGLPLEQALLLGSIVSATDGAAIFAALRDSNLRPRIARTLEAESGLNDPLAVLLVIGLIGWIEQPGYGWSDLLALFTRQLGIGLVAGLAIGWLSVQALRRARLGAEAGYAIAALSAAALAYGAAAICGGSGFLSVYIVGLALGSVPLPAKRAIQTFHQGLAGLAQVTMFLVLGLLVFPSQLGGVALEGTTLALVLVFVSRPLATILATCRTRFTVPERVVLAWAGLRGAVPVVLATFPVIAGVGRSHAFFNIVFFAVLVSAVLQGATFEPLARAMGVVGKGDDDLDLARPVASPIARISTTRPWTRGDGDPSYPRTVAGVPVAAQLLTRIDQPGAVVALADGRYAFTGPIASVGSAGALQHVARRQLVRARGDGDRTWWRQVIAELAR